MPKRKGRLKPLQEVLVDWAVDAASAKADDLLNDLGVALKERLAALGKRQAPGWSGAAHAMADLIGRVDKGSDPYALLGVAPGASPEDIHQAFRAKAKQTHPDLPGGDPEKFQAVLQAYRTLGGT